MRDRREDIRDLVAQFLVEEGDQRPVDEVFDADAMRAFREHTWPGNIRELRNIVLGAAAIGLPFSWHDGPTGPLDPDSVLHSSLDLPYGEARRRVTDVFEREYCERLLERAGGSVRAAARIGRIDRGYLTKLLNRHNLR